MHNNIYWNKLLGYSGTPSTKNAGHGLYIELTEPRDDQVSAIRKMENVKYAGLSVNVQFCLNMKIKN